MVTYAIRIKDRQTGKILVSELLPLLEAGASWEVSAHD